MSRNLGMDAPPAARVSRAGWRDPRLWIGVALVATSVLVGAKVLGGADKTIEVWAASADLTEGQPVGESDLTPQRIRMDSLAEHYLRVGQDLPDGARLLHSVAAGEILPAGALGAPHRGLVEVPVWAPVDAIPASVRAGSTVDVWVTPIDGSGAPGAKLVLDDVVVVALPRTGDSFSPSGSRQVLVGVPPGDISGVGIALAAAKDNRVAFTRKG